MTQYSKVKVGDKIIVTDSEYPMGNPNGTIMTVVVDRGYGCLEATVDGSGDALPWLMEPDTYEPYTKETPKAQEPKLWKDMTPEEKGALLLAEYEGKDVMQLVGSQWVFKIRYQSWVPDAAYQIKPAEPVVETVNCLWAYEKGGKEGYCHPINYSATHKITLTIRDGVVDPIAQVEEL